MIQNKCLDSVLFPINDELGHNERMVAYFSEQPRPEFDALECGGVEDEYLFFLIVSGCGLKIHDVRSMS